MCTLFISLANIIQCNPINNRTFPNIPNEKQRKENKEIPIPCNLQTSFMNLDEIFFRGNNGSKVILQTLYSCVIFSVRYYYTQQVSAHSYNNGFSSAFSFFYVLNMPLLEPAYVDIHNLLFISIQIQSDYLMIKEYVFTFLFRFFLFIFVLFYTKIRNKRENIFKLNLLFVYTSVVC